MIRAPAAHVALVLLGIVAVALPYVVQPFYVSVATQILIFGLFAMSIDLLGGYVGLMPLGHAGLLGVAAYATGYLISRLEWSWPPTVAVALALTVAVSAVFGLLAVRTRGIFFVMITLAEGMLVWGLAYRWSSVTGADNGIRGIERPDFATPYWQYYYLALGVFAACALVLALVARSPFGLTLKGIRESEPRMRTLGYDVVRHKVIAFVVSGLFAGIAGVLYAWYNGFVSPSAISVTASTEGILMVVLGGVGTLVGPVVGAGVIVLIKDLLSSYVTRWPTVMGLIFILVVLFARDGVVGTAGRAWARAITAPVDRTSVEGDRPRGD